MDYRGLPPLNIFFARSTQGRNQGRRYSAPTIDRPVQTPPVETTEAPAVDYGAADVEVAREVTVRKGLPLWAKGLLYVLWLGVTFAGGFGAYKGGEAVYNRYFSQPAAIRQVDTTTDNSGNVVPSQNDNQVVVPNNPVVVDNPPANTVSNDSQLPSLQSQIYEKLLFNVPEIQQFPQSVVDGAVSQIQKTLYERGLAEDERVWQYIMPSVRYGLEGLAQRAASFGYDFNQYKDSEIGQVLLPMELGEVNLMTGQRTEFSLETALFNVTANQELSGMSPQEWITERTLRDYQNKAEDLSWAVVNLDESSDVNQAVGDWVKSMRVDRFDTAYERAIIAAREHTNGNAYGERVNPDGSIARIPIWSNSNAVYQKAVNERLASGDDLTVFLRGYPLVLEITDHPTGEQVAPYISVALASRLGIPAHVVRAHYPTSPEPGWHDEPSFKVSGQNNDPIEEGRFSFYLERQPFIKDYEGQPFSTPEISRRNADGSFEELLP